MAITNFKVETRLNYRLGKTQEGSKEDRSEFGAYRSAVPTPVIDPRL